MKARAWAFGALLAVLALPSGAAPETRYRNPVLYADYSDPDVVRVGSDYYLVASSFHFSPGIPVLHSKDLVHWRILGHVLPRLPFDPAYDMPGPVTLTDATSKPVGKGLRYAGGVWAPSIRHHAGRFYVYWPTPDEGIFMSSAANPAGPWTPPVTVLAGAGYEDPCPFWDDDGKAYLVHSKVGAGPLILHAMRPDGTGVLDDGKVIVEDKVNLPVLEGPKLVKRDGWYYVFAPVGGVGTGPQAVLRSRRIDGPYEYRMVLQPGNGLAGPHQGGYVETEDGEGWFIHFNSTGAFGRIDYLEPVTWRDGWPVIGHDGAPVLDGPVPRTRERSDDYRLADTDEFTTPILGPQWSWNHNPDDTRWSLTQRPGYLRLTAGPAPSLVGARNTLTQVLQGPASQVTARLDVAGMADGQRAGLVLFGVKVPWIGVVRAEGANWVTVAEAGEEKRLARLDGGAVLLRATVQADQTVRFAYARDGEAVFQDAGPPVALARFSWWKGSRPGVFTYVRGENARPGYVDVDWFRVNPAGLTPAGLTPAGLTRPPTQPPGGAPGPAPAASP